MIAIEKVIIKNAQINYIFPHMNKLNWNQTLKPMLKILQSKTNPLQSIQDFTNIISKIQMVQTNYQCRNLKNLEKCYQSLDYNLKEVFFTQFIPDLANLALEVETLFQDNIPLLFQQQSTVIIFTKYQVACLIANMFLCTTCYQYQDNFPKFFSLSKIYEQDDQVQKKNRQNSNINKIKCIIHYLQFIMDLNNQYQVKPPKQNENYLGCNVSYERVQIHNNFNIKSLLQSKTKLSQVTIEHHRKIEDFKGIHIDFANKFIGGGVLKSGCVQEEIMFTVCPENLVSILFSQAMDDTEAILIIGSQQYCKYSGYGSSFQYEQLEDKENLLLESKDVDSKNRIKKYTVAIDAFKFYGSFRSFQDQFSSDCFYRELIKAYIGFQGSDSIEENQQNLQNKNKFQKQQEQDGIISQEMNNIILEKEEQKQSTQQLQKQGDAYQIVTGNWGCGAFKGNHQLKFLIQWIACSLANRKMIYCTFNDENLKNIEQIVEKLKELDIGDIIKLIENYSQTIIKIQGKHSKTVKSLFTFLLN